MTSSIFIYVSTICITLLPLYARIATHKKKKKNLLSGAKNNTIQINPIKEYETFSYHFVIGYICFVVKKSHAS